MILAAGPDMPAVYPGCTRVSATVPLGAFCGETGSTASAWLRWVLNQAAQTAKRSPEFAATYSSIAKRRGKKIATIAISRKLLTRAWHLLNDLQAAADSNAPPRP
jgi:transposase